MAQPAGLELELEVRVRLRRLPFEDGNGTDGTAGVAAFTCLMRRVGDFGLDKLGEPTQTPCGIWTSP